MDVHMLYFVTIQHLSHKNNIYFKCREDLAVYTRQNVNVNDFFMYEISNSVVNNLNKGCIDKTRM